MGVMSNLWHIISKKMSTYIIHCNGHTTKSKFNFFKVMFRTPRNKQTKTKKQLWETGFHDRNHRQLRTVPEKDIL